MQSCEVNVYIDPSLFSLEGRAKQSAASQDALLTGSVFDPNGNAVVGANVRLHNPNTGWSQTAITDASGMFNFPRVPPGDSYVVSVEKAGFATATRPGLALKPGENKLLLAPFELQPAAKPAAVNSFTLQEVLSLLEAGVLPKRVAHLVQERGVGFDLTEELEARLRAAGATDEVLLAIARNRK